MLYGIEGVLTWTVNGTPIEVGPGQALCIPRGAVHRFDNLGNEDVKQLAVISPAIIGQCGKQARLNKARGTSAARKSQSREAI